jgi:type IV pilus assembly protein PilW
MKSAVGTPFSPRSTRHNERGVGLIELLVSLALGTLLIFGATQAYVDSRRAYAINETIGRMHETARYAISVMESDVRMANYWGLLKGAESIGGRAGQSDAQSVLGGNAARTCGRNFALDLDNSIEGTNGTYSASCPAKNDNAVANADTLTIRRASTVSSASKQAGPLRICSTRLQGVLVTDPSASALCAGAKAQVNDLIVNLYYIDRDSDQRTGVPSLRRKLLNATSDFEDAEIVPGVEDMQIQFGVDMSGGVGSASGAAVRYLDAGPTLTELMTNAEHPAQIVSVRVWLLIRADTPEAGFVDKRIYEYGNRRAAHGVTADLASGSGPELPAYRPSLSSDVGADGAQHYRRILVSRTFQLRNALGT